MKKIHRSIALKQYKKFIRFDRQFHEKTHDNKKNLHSNTYLHITLRIMNDFEFNKFNARRICDIFIRQNCEK